MINVGLLSRAAAGRERSLKIFGNELQRELLWQKSVFENGKGGRGIGNKRSVDSSPRDLTRLSRYWGIPGLFARLSLRESWDQRARPLLLLVIRIPAASSRPVCSPASPLNAQNSTTFYILRTYVRIGAPTPTNLLERTETEITMPIAIDLSTTRLSTTDHSMDPFLFFFFLLLTF